MIGVVLALSVVLLAVFGLPLFVLLGLLTLALSALLDAPEEIVLSMVEITSQSELISLPLFTFAGFLMAESNTPQRLVRAARAMFGWMPGGLAIVSLISCAFFTAFTGASGVTIIALGGLLYPMLLRERYPKEFSLGIVTTSGSLGLLFAPSLPIIIYGIVGETSIDQLFVAGLLPGFLLITVLSGYSIFVARKSDVPRAQTNLNEIPKALYEALGELMLIAIVFGGIYGGFFAPLEAAAVTAVYMLVLEMVVHRDVLLFAQPATGPQQLLESGEPKRDIARIMRESMVLIGGILVILMISKGLTALLIDQEVPQKILESMRSLFQSPLTFLLALNLFLLVVGMLMDIFSAIVVVVPLIKPIAMSFGIDPVHLGIIFLTNLEIGYLTPPVGINLFISSFRFKEPVVKLYRVALPFILLLISALMIVTYVPWLSLGMLGDRQGVDSQLIQQQMEAAPAAGDVAAGDEPSLDDLDIEALVAAEATGATPTPQAADTGAAGAGGGEPSLEDELNKLIDDSLEE